MPPIAWKAEFSVGDAAIDHEHKKLVALVNVAGGAILDGRPDADVDRCLGDLLMAISAHFALEERQMHLVGYDQFAAHKADHERLIDELRDIMDMADSHSASTAERLNRSLEAWFSDHFRTHDARLHRQLGPHG